MKKLHLFALLATAIVLPVLADEPAQAPEDPAPEAADENLMEVDANPLFELFYKVDDLLQAEKKDEATDLILSALEDPQYARQKSELSRTIVRFLVFTEQRQKAEDFFLELVRTDPDAARGAFDYLVASFEGGEDRDASLAWGAKLLDQPLTDDLRLVALRWYLSSLLTQDREEDFFAALPRSESLTPESACALAEDLCRWAYHNGRYDFVLRLVETLGKGPFAKEPAMGQTLASQALLARAGKGDWDAVREEFPKVLDILDQRSLQMTLNTLFGRARETKRDDILEALSDQVLRSERCRAFAGVRNTAAREWVAVGARRDAASVPDRIAALRALDVPAATLYLCISRHFFDSLDDQPVVRRYVEEMDAIRPFLDDESRRNSLDSLLMDATFLIGDYERTLAIIDAGISDHDEKWHDMTRTKVKAHMAQRAGKVDEAVALFRKFVDYVVESGENAPDPSTGVVYTPEMLQGVNARRIAGIYAEAGRADEAAKAYAEAREHYQKALAIAKGTETEKGLGEETVQAIEKALSELP